MKMDFSTATKFEEAPIPDLGHQLGVVRNFRPIGTNEFRICLCSDGKLKIFPNTAKLTEDDMNGIMLFVINWELEHGEGRV